MNQTLVHPAALLGPAATSVRGRRTSLQLIVAAVLGDAAVAAVALATASWLRFESSLANWGTDARTLHWTDYRGPILLGTVLFTSLGFHFGLYTLPLVLRYRLFLGGLLKTAAAWVVAFISLAFLLHFARPVSRLYVVVALGTMTASLLLWRRLFYKLAIRAAGRGRLRQRVLFVDWSPHAAALADAMTFDRQHLFEIAGCVAIAGRAFGHAPPRRLRLLGGTGDLAGTLRCDAIDLVVLAGLKLPAGEIRRLANLCEKELVEFKVIPDCFEILTSGLHLEAVSGVPVLGLSRLPLDHPLNLALKRAIDVAGALAGLVLSAPLVALFAWLVHRESPGPVFYRQQRLGRDGHPFWLYKIRSMRLDAERDGLVGWSTRDDPRRLRIGAFMRRWNIDELPQFWNVLKGDMSLVGPRPERPELIAGFKEEIPHYNARHGIKPGITGWAQVNGLRGDTDLGERIRYDLHYIENWSALLDLQIMLITFFTHKNAC